MVRTKNRIKGTAAAMVALFAALAMQGAGAPAAFAAGGSDTPDTRSWATDPVIDQMKSLAAGNNWPAAQALMRDAVAKNSQSADYNNLYAFAIRKGANPDMNLVFKHYNEALRIDPKHRGTHEYIGEAYLMTGNLAKAKEHLTALDRLCTFGCEEYTDLKKAVAAYEAQKK